MSDAGSTDKQSRDAADRAWIIRAAQPGDVPAVAALVGEFAAYMLELGDDTPLRLDALALERGGFGPDPAFRGLVAEAGGVVVGYLLYHGGYDTDEATRQLVVADLFVTPSARCQGVGAALLSEARAVAAATGARQLTWTIDRRNVSAQRFYQGQGARTIDELLVMAMPV